MLISVLLACGLTRAQAPATTTVADVIYHAEAVTAREILDEEKFRDGLSKIIDGTVQCLNASTWAKAR